MAATGIHMGMAMADVATIPIIITMIVMRTVRIGNRIFGITGRAMRVCNLFPGHREAWVDPPARK